jgi:uncharacterized cupredoxin-like copper-binding protein
MSRSAVFIILTLALPAAAGAQVRDSAPKVKQVVPPTPRTPRMVTITYTDNAFDVPEHLPAGMTTFHAVNNSKELHHGTLVRLDSGRTVPDLLEALKKSGPLPTWAKLYGGPQNAGTVTMNLPAGNYVWVCLIPGADGIPHFVKGMVRPLTVGPDKLSASAPAPDRIVTMADYNFTISRPITRGRHVLRVVTAAKSQPHELVIIHLSSGTSAKDVMAWSAHPNGPPPAESVEGIAAMNPGTVNYTTVDFKPGNYVLICFVPDAKDGQPHAAHGMVKEFTVQ